GVVGGAAGGAGKALEKGLARAKKLVDGAGARLRSGSGTGAIPEDLASLDRAGLKAAREAEVARLVDEQATAKAAAADALEGYRAKVDQANPWLAIAEGEEAKLLTASSRQLRNALNDPKGLRRRPDMLLKPLRVQEQSFERALAKA